MARLLAFFLANQGRVISREELIASVWENRVVSDDAINRCISILRQTLSPQETHALIETVTRRGYIAHFPPAPDPQPADTEPDPPRRPGLKTGRRAYLAAAALFAITVLGAALWFVKSARIADGPDEGAADKPPVVAVLPFATSGHGEDDLFFANGLHEDLLTQLAQVQALRVISRTSVLDLRGGKGNLREIGRELGADAILEGSVQSLAGQIRINVQLIDTRTDSHLWAQTYDRALSPGNLFAVQSEIARAVASALHTKLTAHDASQLAILPTENMAAYRAYHQAMAIRDSTGVDDPAYLAALERAVTLDPEYVRAWAELAGLLGFQYFSLQDDGTVKRVERIIDRIRTLAPDSADHLIAQAYYTYYILRNYGQAYRLIMQAQDLRPSDVRLLELKSWVARRMGDSGAMIESMRVARTLDPRNPRWTIALVRNLMIAHRYDEASREVESSGIQHYELALMESTLAARHHRGLDRWATEVAELVREYGNDADPSDLWNALVAIRNFAAAEAVARDLPDDFEHGEGMSPTGLPAKAYFQILSHWFLQSDEQLDQQLAGLRRSLDEMRDSDGGSAHEEQYLVRALLTAAEGDAAETERLVRRWRREAGKDRAELSANRHFACRFLGMVAATSAAVGCLRESLEEPSRVMPFIEPRLPYYDSIRKEAQFAELLAELDQQ